MPHGSRPTATGWSSVAIGQAYPLVIVDGFDLEADAIAAAHVGSVTLCRDWAA
jgi:hypothetical protein